MAGFIGVRRIITGLCAAFTAIALAPEAAAYQPAALVVLQGERFIQASPIDGSHTQPWNYSWADTTSFVTNGVDAYAILGGDLVRFQPGIGAWWAVGSDTWSGPTELAFGWRQDITTPFLWAVQDGYLYRIELEHGHATMLGGRAWVGSTSMTYLDYNGTLADLFIVQANSLWRVNSNTGARFRLGTAGAWSGETSMTTTNRQLYIYQNNRLWQVNPSDGATTQLGGAYWAGTTSMTALNGSLYVIEGDHLHRVDPSNGVFETLGAAHWGGPTFMGTISDRP